MDNGVLQSILQKQTLLSGNEYEGAIIAEIYKQIKNHNLPLACYYLRTHDGKEVDLLLEAADYFIAIEIKATEHAGKTDVRHLIGLQDILNKPLKQCFLLSNDSRVQHFGDNIIAMHAAAFLC
jgi:predicted AAA+ superfamily ATPase